MKAEFIAEIGGNHKGDFTLATKLVTEACESGSDVIKLQLYTAKGLVNEKYDLTRFNHFKKFELKKEEYIALAKIVKASGKKFCASIWDIKMFDWIIDYVDIIKIGSGDFTYLPLIKQLLKLEKEIILSTGLCNEVEVKEVMTFIKKNTTSDFFKNYITIMQCTSMYPIPENESNLNVINNFKNNYNCKIGYSDHNIGMDALKIALDMGVNSIEFHFTLNKADTTFRDNLVSLETDDVKALKLYEKKTITIKGSHIKKPSDSEIESGHNLSFRRGCYAKRSITKGEIINEDDIIFLRPYIENSLSPLFFNTSNKKLKVLKDLEKLEVISTDVIEVI